MKTIKMGKQNCWEKDCNSPSLLVYNGKCKCEKHYFAVIQKEEKFTDEQIGLLKAIVKCII